MHIRLLSAAFLTMVIYGCVGSRAYSEMWEKAGSLRVAEPDAPTHQYKFYIKAGRDFGLNTQNLEDRLVMIRGYLEHACKDVAIINEDFLPAGGTAIGDLRLGTYVSRVKCIP